MTSLAEPHASVPPVVDDQASALRRLVARTSFRSTPRGDRPTLGGGVGAPVVAIASGKGGVGKTTLSVSAAIALHRKRRTILVDADLGTANADVLCGLAPTRRLEGELFRASGPDLASIAIETPWGFRLVPGAAGVAHAPMLDPGQRAGFIEALRALAPPGEAVLVDHGAGISAPIIESVAASDLALIVTTAEPAALADAYALIKCVTRHRGDPRPLRMGLVVNMVETRGEGRAAHARIDRVCARFLGGSMPLIGLVRRDKRALLASRGRVPLLAGWPFAPASRDIREIAGMIAALAPRIGRVTGGGTRP